MSSKSRIRPPLADLIYGVTSTRDGSITISAATPAQRVGVLHAIDKAELLTDQRFSTLDALMKNRDEYQPILVRAFSELPTADLINRLRNHDVPCAQCLSRDEVLAHPQLAANGSIGVIDHPRMGRHRIV